MSLSRRDFLKLTGLVAASTALASCSSIYEQLAGTPFPPHPMGDGPGPELSDIEVVRAFTTLSRLTFGPRTDERARVAEIGLAAWVEEQLTPESIDDGPANWRVRRFDVLEMSAGQLRDRADEIFDAYDPWPVINDFRQATLLRQIYSNRQLYEVMVEFWSDHFNISMQKGDCWFLKIVDDREVIRPYALGNFRDLLQASAHSPAMLVYLDNQSNLKDEPNENYARELMELHTLGVNGGYTQHDVMELARCLTGWTVKENFFLGEFTFDETLHDNGSKIVLDKTIQPNGQSEAEQILDLLAMHPSTAHFISSKLARRFVADDPPAELVERAAQAFLQTGGDIKSVLQTILLDGLTQPRCVQPKFKRPLNFMVSALRMLGATTDGAPVLHEQLGLMGHSPFAWPTPDGFPDVASAWMGNLLPRWRFALDLAANRIEGTQIDIQSLVDVTDSNNIETFIDGLSPILMGTSLPPTDRDAIAQALRGAGAKDDIDTASITIAGILSSPAFQWR